MSGLAAAALRAAAAVAWFLVLASVVAERRFLRRLRGAGADSPATAIPLPLRPPMAKWRLRTLMRDGAIVAAGTGSYYLDATRYASFCQRRRWRALTLMAAGLLLLLVFWLARSA